MKNFYVSFLFLLISCIIVSCGTRHDNYKDEFFYKSGLNFLEDCDTIEAVKCFENAIDMMPDNGYAYQQLAAIYMNQGQLGDAMSYASKSIECIPSSDGDAIASAYATRFNLHLLLNDTTNALKDIKKAIRKVDDNDLKESLLNMRAYVFLEQKKYGKAESDFEKMLSINSVSRLALLGLSKLSATQENYEEALSYISKVNYLYPDDEDAALFLIDVLIKVNRYPEAIDKIVELFESDPHEVYDKIGIIVDSVAENILPRLQNIADENSFDWNVQYYTGLAHMRKEPIAALKYLHRALQLSDFLEDVVYEGIASCYSSVGMYDHAVSYLKKAVEIDSSEESYLSSLYSDLYSAGRIDESMSICSQLIKKYPNNPVYYCHRAWCRLLENRNFADAINDYDKAIEIDSSFSYAYLQRGLLYSMMGNKEKSMADMLLSLKYYNPDDDNHLHYVYYYLGKDSSAIASIQETLKNDYSVENMYDAACLYSLMDKEEVALDYLQKSLEHGYSDIYHLTHDNDLDNIRHTKQYVQLVGQYSSKIKTLAQSIHDPLLMADASVKKENKLYVTDEIPFTRQGKDKGMEVYCVVNGVPVKMVFDTGCDGVCITSAEYSFLRKNGCINDDELMGYGYVTFANGETAKERRVLLKEVRLGALTLHNVTASITKNPNAEPLLGMGVLSKIDFYEIDNVKQVIRIRFSK